MIVTSQKNAEILKSLMSPAEREIQRRSSKLYEFCIPEEETAEILKTVKSAIDEEAKEAFFACMKCPGVGLQPFIEKY